MALPEERLVFNQEVTLDLFWQDGKAVLHVVDMSTGFANAAFLSGRSVNDVWSTLTKY